MKFSLAKLFGKLFLNNKFEEKEGIITLRIRISGNKHQTSDPDLYKDNTVAESMPVNGTIWVKGYMTDKGVKPYSLGELGHEVMHVLAHQCEGFADPDAKETFFGTMKVQ